MMSLNQLKKRVLLYGGLAGGAGIVVGAAIATSMQGGEGFGDNNSSSANKQAVGATLVREMDARTLDPEDALNTDVFTTTNVFSKILAKRAELRWNEAPSRVDRALENSFEAIGATTEDTSDQTQIARLRAATCATWLLNGEDGNVPTALLGPTRTAYTSGDFATAEERCRDAIVRRVVEGELDYIVVITGLNE